MPKAKTNKEQSVLETKNCRESIGNSSYEKFISDFIDDNIDVLIDEEEYYSSNGAPKKPYEVMVKVITYGANNNISSTDKLSKRCQTDEPFKFMAEGEEIGGSTIREFKLNNMDFSENLNALILEKAKEWKITNFDDQVIDGTTMHAFNSNYNMIRLGEIEELLRIVVKGEKYVNDFLETIPGKCLRKSSRKFLMRTDMSNKEKLIQLYFMWSLLFNSKQSSIGFNDFQALWIETKEGTIKLGYLPQLTVDLDSGLITGIRIVRAVNDYHQFIPQIKKFIKDLGKVPRRVLADSAFRVTESMKFSEENNIDFLTPSRYDAEKSNGKSSNVFYYTEFIDVREDGYLFCPLGEPLPLKYHYDYEPPVEKYVGESCDECLFRPACTKEKYRMVSRQGSPLQRKFDARAYSDEGKEFLKKRGSCVERTFALLKRDYGLNSTNYVTVPRIQREAYTKVSAFNLKVIYNILKERAKVKDEEKLKRLQELDEYKQVSLGISNYKCIVLNTDNDCNEDISFQSKLVPT